MRRDRLALGFLALVLSLSSVGQQLPSVAQPPGPNQPAQAIPTASGPPDPLLDVPPLPKGKVSLIGGTVKNIDHVRNRMTVKVFGGDSMKVRFDERTHIYRNGVETTQLGIHKGDRVYVDTQLDKVSVLARNIRVLTEVQAADARGQVLSFNPSSGRLALRDQISSAPVIFRVTPQTVVRRDHQNSSQGDLRPGSLVAVKFAPDKSTRGVAQEINVLAVPGTLFTFAGHVTFLDLKNGMLAVQNSSDDQNYDIRFDPSIARRNDELGVGAEISVVARFRGSDYLAESVTVTQPAASETEPKSER